MLIILGGLPGVGKTTIARRLGELVGALHLRIDTIETSIKAANLSGEEVEKSGYLIAYEIAKDNLLLGHTVIADSVNSIAITREAWKYVAQSMNNAFIEIEIVCSDKKIHQERVEKRVSDINGLQQPSWQEIQDREYDLWDSCDFKMDTSKFTLEECVSKIEEYLNEFEKPTP